MPKFSSFFYSNVYYFAKIALVNPANGEIYTYRELLDKVNRAANGFKKIRGRQNQLFCYLQAKFQKNLG
jgi:acyl-coenzyme A synthetase/AMP-(fatty) acid ligase